MLKYLLCVILISCGPGPSATSVPRPPKTIANVHADPTGDEALQKVAIVTRMLTAIRYLHPSDQSAAMDWTAFTEDAIDAVLTPHDHQSLTRTLQSLAREVAPTAVVYEDSPPKLADERPDSATGLVRWRHLGLGPSQPYRSFREGIDSEKDFSLELSTTPKIGRLAKCGSVDVTFNARHTDTLGSASAFVVPEKHPDLKVVQEVTGSNVAIKLHTRVPAAAEKLTIGIVAKGGARVELSGLHVKCASGESDSVDVAKGSWLPDGDEDLYSVGPSRCGDTPCLVVERNPIDNVWDASRDLLNIDLGGGFHMTLPAAVWTDGAHTLPVVTGAGSHHSRRTSMELAVRLASVGMTWGTLSLFYPYFKDLNIDWDAQLPLALRAAAKATDLVQQKHVLSELVAKLRDDHSFVVHPSVAMDGVIPMRLRRFGDQGIVIARDAKYLPDLNIGDEITAIDGMRFGEIYDRVSRDVSAATPGWLDVATEFLIISGEANKARVLHARSKAGTERDFSITTVPGKEVASTVREPRPKMGEQVAPGVIYLDLDEMDDAALEKAMPSLTKASAVIMDLRGYLKKAAYTALAHFASGPVAGPKLQIPLVRDLGPHKLVDVTAVSIGSALKPHLTAKLFLLVNGETASSPESMIQIVRNGKMGILVGEPTGGTNGNANRFEVAGGFTVRFTGMRAVMDDGRVVQGNGFQPEIVVHPTVEGIRAGRDEILEAAIAAAARH